MIKCFSFFYVWTFEALRLKLGTENTFLTQPCHRRLLRMKVDLKCSETKQTEAQLWQKCKKQSMIVFSRTEDHVNRPLTFEVLISDAHGGVVYNLSQQEATAHRFLFCQRRRLLCCKPWGFRNQTSTSSQAFDKQMKSADKQEKFQACIFISWV